MVGSRSLKVRGMGGGGGFLDFLRGWSSTSLPEQLLLLLSLLLSLLALFSFSFFLLSSSSFSRSRSRRSSSASSFFLRSSSSFLRSSSLFFHSLTRSVSLSLWIKIKTQTINHVFLKNSQNICMFFHDMIMWIVFDNISSLLTGAYATPTSSTLSWMHVWQSAKARNSGLVLHKRIDLLQKAFINPRSLVEHFLWWMDALFWASKSLPSL